MNSGVIRVNPASVRDFGTRAQANFTEINQKLNELVASVANVRYFGPNAVEFKQKTAELAATFARETHLKMQQIAEAVKTSTSNISSALGGAAISIQVDARPVEVPTIATVDYVDVDTNALSDLKETVSTKFAAINSAFDANLAALRATDWQGQAKASADTAVSNITLVAKSTADSALGGINKAIQAQIDSVIAADR